MAARKTSGISGVLLWRALFSALGFGIAIVSAMHMERQQVGLYAAAFLLIALSYSFWLDSPRSFGLPYLCVMIAFIYIGGLPVIALDYLAELLVLPLIAVLTRTGLVRPPQPLAPLVDALRGVGGLADALANQGAKLATGALGFAVRYVTFVNVLRYVSEPFVAIIVAEVAGYTCWWMIHVVLPVPTADIFENETGGPARLDAEGVDLALASGLLLPPLTFLIYYGYHTHGLLGATSWSLATIGPHYVIRRMHNRRNQLIDQNLSLRAQSLRLEQLNEALNHNQEDLRTFVYTVTHDLKNPVSAILLTASVLLRREKGSLRPTSQRNLELIFRFAAETETMIRDLMQLFKITATAEARTWVDLQVLVARALECLRPQIDEKQTCIDIGPLSPVWGEQSKLGHVVNNLLSNAVKYVSPMGGRVEISSELEGRTALVRVCDNGIGIPRAYHKTIFDIFTRVPREDETEEDRDPQDTDGSGVGLAIVKRIVDAHSGAVWVESAPGKGSSFFVRLPVPQQEL